eukprot:12930397-Alexandrium_andersonii.AAC.1
MCIRDSPSKTRQRGSAGRSACSGRCATAVRERSKAARPPTHDYDVLRRTATYNDVLRRTTTDYDGLRRTTTYYDVLRRTTRHLGSRLTTVSEFDPPGTNYRRLPRIQGP